MLKLMSLFIISNLILSNSWVLSDIENNLTIEFPSKPKFEKLFTDYRIYSCENKNCDFSVNNDEYPKPVFPNSEEEQALLFERSIANSKAKGIFINSQKIVVGRIIGIEIKSYFIMPNTKNKCIQVERTFFLNFRIYTVRCLYKNKDENICDKDCKRFFSSLKFHS